MRKLVCLVMLMFVCGCDHFFCVDALVVDGVTGIPVAGAKGTLVLDRGVEELDVVAASADDGQITMCMNEPADAWATLTIEKQGYCVWSAQFRGAPRNQVSIQLQRCENASGELPESVERESPN